MKVLLFVILFLIIFQVTSRTKLVRDNNFNIISENVIGDFNIKMIKTIDNQLYPKGHFIYAAGDYIGKVTILNYFTSSPERIGFIMKIDISGIPQLNWFNTHKSVYPGSSIDDFDVFDDEVITIGCYLNKETIILKFNAFNGDIIIERVIVNMCMSSIKIHSNEMIVTGTKYIQSWPGVFFIARYNTYLFEIITEKLISPFNSTRATSHAYASCYNKGTNLLIDNNEVYVIGNLNNKSSCFSFIGKFDINLDKLLWYSYLKPYAFSQADALSIHNNVISVSGYFNSNLIANDTNKIIYGCSVYNDIFIASFKTSDGALINLTRLCTKTDNNIRFGHVKSSVAILNDKEIVIGGITNYLHSSFLNIMDVKNSVNESYYIQRDSTIQDLNYLQNALIVVRRDYMHNMTFSCIMRFFIIDK